MKTKLIFVVAGRTKMKLNSDLVKRQGLSDEDVKELIRIHRLRHRVILKMKETDEAEELRKLNDQVTEYDFQLQKVWKFEVNANYHLWWDVPKCICPKIDNRELRGSDKRIISSDCPIHSR